MVKLGSRDNLALSISNLNNFSNKFSKGNLSEMKKLDFVFIANPMKKVKLLDLSGLTIGEVQKNFRLNNS